MAKQTDEAWVKKELKAFFDLHNCKWYMPATHGLGKSGAGDFYPVIVPYDGHAHVWAVEAKGRHYDKTTPLQRLELQDVYDHNGSVAVVDRDNIEDFKERFEEYLRFPPIGPADLRRDDDRKLPG